MEPVRMLVAVQRQVLGLEAQLARRVFQLQLGPLVVVEHGELAAVDLTGFKVEGSALEAVRARLHVVLLANLANRAAEHLEFVARIARGLQLEVDLESVLGLDGRAEHRKPRFRGLGQADGDRLRAGAGACRVVGVAEGAQGGVQGPRIARETKVDLALVERDVVVSGEEVQVPAVEP